ncbi:carboxypeptidase-like regulatory domain-containing protein [Mesonia sp. MT50]|uniref:Carboxypeptidase-like regulatory domain-containing protein n=1 Tax=Mesonia profundi TaxID=3070998 RepID=A0ABU1A3A9_9FLAO|nr:carboxypeptidase-like regulatory domain-containing protein [Mesonia profundi]MDQ7918104.1 carboxypeptidase-like regulatory domain-containing protein [Mesonia profundi]
MLSGNSFAQQIVRGFVVDSVTQKPIEGAAVFFDKTTYGTITNKNGFFVLKSREKTKSPLVIKYLGYRMEKMINPPQNKNVKFILVKQEEDLNAVVIYLDKKRKKNTLQQKKSELEIDQHLHLFKHYFLGKGAYKNKVEILNPEVVKLVSSKDGLKFTYTTEKPLIIKNNYLDYEITYYLEKLVLYQKANELIPHPVMDHYEYYGTALFKDLQKPDKIRNKFKKRRNEFYYGSILHFMRALSKNELEENGFSTFDMNSNWITIKSTPKFNFMEVMPPNKFLVFYRKVALRVLPSTISDFETKGFPHDASLIIARNNFGIDEMGNFFPWNALIFDGKFGREGMDKSLPLDFQPYP